MFSIQIHNLFAVSAPSMAELETLIARAQALRETHAPAIAQAAQAQNASHAPAMGGKGANLAKWEAINGGKRLRMTNEERATYGEGEQAREQTAAARLLASGETLASGESGDAGGAGVACNIDIDTEIV
jgi:hypothetical protein